MCQLQTESAITFHVDGVNCGVAWTDLHAIVMLYCRGVSVEHVYDKNIEGFINSMELSRNKICKQSDLIVHAQIL